MSLAIPASYSEYIFDTASRNATPPMMCNGEIMPVRNGSGKAAKKCLRGEDIFFIKEAATLRAHFAMTPAGNLLGSGIINRVSKQQLSFCRDALSSCADVWSNSDIVIGGYDFGSSSPTQEQIIAWLKTQITGVTLASANDSYSGLKMTDIQHLMTDISKMNYSVDFSNIAHVYDNTDHDVHGEVYENEQWRTYTDTYTNLWHSREAKSYKNGDELDYSLLEYSENPQVTLGISYDNDAARVVDIKPFALCWVTNSWSWHNDDALSGQGTGDSGNEEHYVMVAMSSGYGTPNGAGQFTPAGALGGYALAGNAASTAGCQLMAEDVPFGSTPIQTGTWGWGKSVNIAIMSVWSVIHLKYTNLESV